MKTKYKILEGISEKNLEHKDTTSLKGYDIKLWKII